MPTAIQGSTKSKLDFCPDVTEARNIIADLHSQITRSDGTIKSGVLKLMHTTPGKPKEMSFERKSWWQFWARRDSKMDVTSVYLKGILNQAFGQNLDTEEKKAAFKKISQEFDNYLAARHNRIGTRTLAGFITRFQNALPVGKPQVSKDGMLPHEYQQWKVTPSATLSAEWQRNLPENIKSDWGHNHIPIADRDAENFSREIIGVLTQSGQKCTELERHEAVPQTGCYNFRGSEKENYSRLNLTFPHTVLPTGPGTALEKGECGAATLGSVPHLHRPTFYLVRSTNETTVGLYKVPTDRLENFLQHLQGEALLVGTITPPPKGAEISKVHGFYRRHDAWVTRDLAKQGIETLLGFSERNIVHGDLNEKTILYDKEDREMRIATTSSLVKMHAVNGREPGIKSNKTIPAGFSHPSILRGKEHGCEADLFSLTTALLDGRFPGLKNVLDARSNEITYMKEWEKPDGNYLRQLVRVGRATKYRNDIEALNEAMQTSPYHDDAQLLEFAKQAIDTSFTTGEKYQGKLRELLQHPYIS